MNECQNGYAGPYPCRGYDLMTKIPISFLDAKEANDCWGWTDPITDREYAIIGLNNGTAFVDITDTENPIYKGKLPTASGNSAWRDIKVHNNYAFIVSEAENHGIQIFDLTKLRNSSTTPILLKESALYTSGIGRAHNIVINSEKNYIYPVGTDNDNYKGGPLFINIENPNNPISEGGWASGGYSHDGQVVTYKGPDSDYYNKEIYIGCNASKIALVDITDKDNPKHISDFSYPKTKYAHQGWLTEDHNFFFVGDESDEIALGGHTRTIVLDLKDLDNPKLHKIYLGRTTSVDHNGYTHKNNYYLASYSSGVRIIDISDIENKQMIETGYFDTYPLNDNASFTGAWSVYPYFKSGNILISDIEEGLFVIKKTGT